MEGNRLFSGETAKGCKNYLNSQKKYELIRTLLYFAISLSLFATGYITTKTKTNLLTIVAVLGCLPACKSFVGMIMFFRYKSLKASITGKIEELQLTMHQAYDMVFTTYQKNYVVGHLVVFQGQICGFTEMENFQEVEFEKHIHQVLGAEGFKEVSMKIFVDEKKYLDRLADLQGKATIENNNDRDSEILRILKSVVL